ncbi:MAG: NHL repeat-containing protein, partial [Flexibacteraceae bacterium]
VSTMGNYSVRVISGSCTSLTSNTIVVDLNVSGYLVTTIAGSGTSGVANGTGTGASFNFPYGVAVDGSGNLYVVDERNHLIRKITPLGVVTTLAGSGTAGYNDGTGTAASFNYPSGIAVDGEGNIFVGDSFNHRIRKITPSGVVTTFAGSGDVGYYGGGFADGNATVSRFNVPRGIAIDGTGNVFVADGQNNRIRKITPLGIVTTLAGTGTGGFLNGIVSNATFRNPSGITVDNFGNVYVADRDNNSIRKINSSGEVSTFAGSGSAGYADGTGTSAVFTAPTGVSVDGAGNVFVVDYGNHFIRKITFEGVTTTIAGSGTSTFSDGIGTAASFNWATGLTLDGLGNAYIADRENNRIRKLTPFNCTTPATPSISGLNEFCPGSSITLTSSAVTGNLWSNGATTQSIVVSTPGNYTVRVI